MIQIQVNGESHTFPDSSNITALLQQLQLENQRLAIEINEELIPRSQFNDHRLKADDKIEIVRAIGGG